MITESVIRLIQSYENAYPQSPSPGNMMELFWVEFGEIGMDIMKTSDGEYIASYSNGNEVLAGIFTSRRRIFK